MIKLEIASCRRRGRHAGNPVPAVAVHFARADPRRAVRRATLVPSRWSSSRWAWLAYFILPYASGFLYGFQTADLQLMLTAEAYFGFVTMLFLAFGLVMEFPIVWCFSPRSG